MLFLTGSRKPWRILLRGKNTSDNTLQKPSYLALETDNTDQDIDIYTKETISNCSTKGFVSKQQSKHCES